MIRPGDPRSGGPPRQSELTGRDSWCEPVLSCRELKPRLIGKRIGDAVGRRVGVSDLLKGGRHLGDDAVTQRDSSRRAGAPGGGLVRRGRRPSPLPRGSRRGVTAARSRRRAGRGQRRPEVLGWACLRRLISALAWRLVSGACPSRTTPRRAVKGAPSGARRPARADRPDLDGRQRCCRRVGAASTPPRAASASVRSLRGDQLNLARRAGGKCSRISLRSCRRGARTGSRSIWRSGGRGGRE